MLELTDVSKVYRREDFDTVALKNVNLTISSGEFVAIMGPSGCGKSTLLNILGLLDQPSTGSYQFMDREVTGLSQKKLSEIRKRKIGFIFQNFNLIDELSVAENIELALLYQGIGPQERRQRVALAMDKVGLAHRAKHRPVQLSGGQQQRVAVARAIVGEQSLILADEPTGNLDSSHGRDVMEMLRELHLNGATVVIVTHSAEHADFAQRTVNLFDGKIVSQNLRATHHVAV